MVALSVAAVVFVVAFSVSAWFNFGGSEELRNSFLKILRDLKYAKFLMAVIGDDLARSFLSDYPFLFLSIPFSAISYISIRALYWVADFLMPPRPSEILRPIPRSGAYDPLWAPETKDDLPSLPIDWASPSPGAKGTAGTARYRIWTELVWFLDEQVGGGGGWPFHSRAGVVWFRAALLAGPSGAGKTRMATELARARARCEMVAGGPPTGAGAIWRARRREQFRAMVERLRHRRHRVVAPAETGQPSPAESSRWDGWWHAVAPRTIRYPWTGCDLWDAWWLVSASGGGLVTHQERRAFDAGVTEQLSRWRPRRPTLLLLDDPRDGDAAKVIATLQKNEPRFRHPVRLIVTQQTPPIELDLIGPDGSFEPTIRGVDQYFRLDEGMGPAEVRALAGSLRVALEEGWRDETDRNHLKGKPSSRPRPVVRWKGDDRTVDALIRRTAGNPLLIALSLQTLFLHPGEVDPGPHAVLAKRARRIHQALQGEKINEDAIRAIALATLVGDVSIPATVRAGIPLLQGEFPPKLLGAVPNLRRGEGGGPPRVHPERIGDAFVAYLLGSVCSEEQRDEVIRQAWQAAPEAMPHATWRLAAAGDGVAASLWREMAAVSVRDPQTTTLAFLRWACLIPRIDWDLGDVPGRVPLSPLAANGLEGGLDPEEAARHRAVNGRADHALGEALVRIRSLAPAQAAALWEQMATLVAIDRAVAVLHGAAVWRCLIALLERALSDAQVWSAPDDARRASETLWSMLAAPGRWGGIPDGQKNEGDAVILQRVGQRLAVDGVARAALWQDFDRTDHIFGNDPILPYLEKWVVAVVVGENEDRAESAITDRDGEEARIRAWRLRGWACRRDQPACEAIARQIDEIARPFAGEVRFELERAKAWRDVAAAYGGDRVSCEAMARRVEGIAAPFAGDARFEWERAKAWRYVAEACRDDRVSCEGMARRVEEIAAPFAGDAGFELERAQAWRFVAYACRDDRVSCETMARRVEGIAAPFAGDPKFERQRTEAWSYVSPRSPNFFEMKGVRGIAPAGSAGGSPRNPS